MRAAESFTGLIGNFGYANCHQEKNRVHLNGLKERGQRGHGVMIKKEIPVCSSAFSPVG